MLDSRATSGGAQIRRRRECLQCQRRFTTREEAVLVMPKVVKRNGARVEFSEDRLRNGIERALEKRPISSAEVSRLLDDLKNSIRSIASGEIDSHQIGEMVMSALYELDRVAYIRFASVYRRFEDPEDFSRALQGTPGDGGG